MNEFEAMHLVWLLGALVLVGSGLAGYRLSWKKGFVLALVWFGIFVLMTLFIDLVM